MLHEIGRYSTIDSKTIPSAKVRKLKPDENVQHVHFVKKCIYWYLYSFVKIFCNSVSSFTGKTVLTFAVSTCLWVVYHTCTEGSQGKCKNSIYNVHVIHVKSI